MNRLFQEMYSNVTSEVQDTSTNMVTLVKNFINRRYAQIMRSFNWDIKRLDYTVSTIAGTQDYGLPSDFGNALYVYDPTNKKELSEQDYNVAIQSEPSMVGSTGTPTSYSVLQDVVLVQPTSAIVISVASSSASDISQAVFVRGIVGGSETTETISLVGTTVSSGSLLFSRVMSITKTATTVGAVTVTAGTQTLAVIDPERTVYSVKKMRLFPTPSYVATLQVPYYINPQPLINNYDFPVIDCSDCIEAGARADAWRYKRQLQKANVEELNFRTILSELIHQQVNKPNKIQQFLPTANATAYDRDTII